MYRNKKDVDKHVENLISKLSVKEFKTRAYSIARLYYEVGDYASCQRYVEQYLTQKDNNAAAYKLLGQALQKLGQKEKALEQYKTSLDIDPTQTSTILDICELLVDDEVSIDPGRARYWCEKAEATFPKHPVTFRLRERLVTLSNPDPEAVIDLLTSELVVRPKDALLHARLLKHYMHTNKIKEAIEHSCNVEFGEKSFRNNYAWYESLAEVMKHNSHNFNDWLFQLLLLTIRERMCVLSLSETTSSPPKSMFEANELLFLYDQDIEKVAKAGATPGFGEFHASLLIHHRGQFAFHAATFLLKKAKKDQLSWSEAVQFAAPLMLMAWHTPLCQTKSNWVTSAPEKQQKAADRWYTEASFRCSQAGHYLIANSQEKTQSFIDRISQCCSGTHWRDKLYEKIFTTRSHLSKIKTSHFVTSNAFATPVLRLPRKNEVIAYDVEAQREYANSLHHYVWILLNYKKFAHFKCSLFDSLTPSASNCGPESMDKIDILAFLYCATLTSKQQKPKDVAYLPFEKPSVLPANITDLLCSLPQMKWWDCAYKFTQNELGAELTDIRATLSRGIEVVRCIDHHGLDPELLCNLGRIFSEKAKQTVAVEEKANLDKRAYLYYSSAVPLLDKLKNKIVIKLPEKRMFDYTHKELGTKELNCLIEESKIFVAVSDISDCNYDKAIELLSSLKSPEAHYHLCQAYKKIAVEENNSKEKYVMLLTKARSHAFNALEGMIDKNTPLYSEAQELLEELETLVNKIDPDLSGSVNNDVDRKYSSDENVSIVGNEYQLRTNHVFRNISSTPKAPTHTNVTNYRTAVDSHILESTRLDHKSLERIENEIKNLQRRENTINDFMEQSKKWFDENRKLGNEIISTIHSNIQNTTDQFKLLKISVDQVKDQIDECRNECKDVGELKKQIAEMKKEINKLKKASSEQNIDENDLYNLEDDYRTNDSASTFAAQLPFTPQVMPTFNQRLVPPFPVPPNPYQLYGQNLYNLYSQYSQFGQSTQVPGAPPIFDPARGPMNFPGVYPTSNAMYLDVTQLVPSSMPPAPTASVAAPVPVVPSMPTVPTVSSVPTVSVPPSVTSVTMSKPVLNVESKEIPRSLPMNVVITSSDPLPTCTTTPAPVLSVTIPAKHIKGTPHNYQIPMPSANETKVISPPVFSFPSSNSKLNINNFGGSSNNWNQSSVFKTTSPSVTLNTTSDSLLNTSKPGDTLDNSKCVVDGAFTGQSPNISLNKSRTLSERSNTSVENYDPCPDFKPIIPLPAEVKVTTGEEDESVIFNSRAKLFRFVDKQWKERGIGEMKLLKHKVTGKVRVLMRREQIHKICANHIITHEMEISPMKNETKAYFWVANDFADETLVLEKFCIRFKTADIAQQFYEKFEEARKQCTAIETAKEEDKKATVKLQQTSTPVKTDVPSNASQTTKSGFTVGGFTFSSTPTFKSVSETAKADNKSADTPTTKVNVFSGLTFKTNASSPFSNIFTTPVTTTQQTVETSSPSQGNNNENKLNNSDTVEEYEPNVEFKPVIPLPALVEQKTGEEDESVLFEHRAKLLRFDSATKEWKERGLGNIKILVHKDNNQKVRLLMRREQIMKVCCNHALTKDMTFQKMPNIDKAVTWCAKDFSEGELVAETFCLRFKTVQTCDEFIKAVQSAQSKIKDDKAAKEEQNAAKQNTQIGFGDIFKPKPGAWHCDSCYTNNLESFNKCACCEQPKPSKGVVSTSSSTSSSSIIFGKPTSAISTPTSTSNPTSAILTQSSNWGDAFKPKPGTWECKACFVRNEAGADNCTACNSPKDPTTAKSAGKTTPDSTIKFNFGIPKETPSAPPPASVTGWGDKFKPKEGSWECKQCFVRNEADVQSCGACSNPKDPSAAPKDTKSVFGLSNAAPKFTFGIPANTTVERNIEQTSSIFDGTGAHKFSFGIPATVQNNNTSVISFGDQKQSSPSNLIFAAPKLSSEKASQPSPLNFSIKKDDESVKPVISRPALLPDPPKEQPVAAFGAKESGTFDFVFKPKTPPKGKSPAKSPKAQDGGESDDNEYASEDEGHHIHFSPVIPLPDKVEVVTGEENEDELYGHRAKLFRFAAGEWKERGIGIVKILKNRDTGKLRVVMRREQVLKICLNHALTPEIIYTPKDDKTWLFTANDFSEGELTLQQFCLRFKNKDIAMEFKNAVEAARQYKTEPVSKMASHTSNKDNDSDDVIFVDEIQASAEEKQKAKDLMLPENFFTYKVKEPCQGCRGCEADDKKEQNVEPTKPSAGPVVAVTSAVSTPSKNSTPPFSSPSHSFYGTPATFDKTDVSIFRTPLGSLASNTKSSATPSSSVNNSTLGSNVTDKENTFTQKSLFGGFGEQKTLFGTPQSKNSTVTDTTESQTPVSTKSSILAAPKLGKITLPGEEKQTTDPKSLFSAAVQSKPLFGGSLFGNSNTGKSLSKSIFGFSENKDEDSVPNNNRKVISIFGGDAEQKPVNLFSSTTSQGSLFGPGSLSKSNEVKSEVLEVKPKETTSEDKTELWKDNNNLTFAALSSSTPGFSFQKKPDFKWEGAGQQLFGSTQKSTSATGDKSKNDSGAGEEADAEEEYDPHYEPIVPLPDKIVVTTGEEDEEKMFGERCKLYRYDEKSREWKERGVGEMKILYHPERKSYRLLLRREQVHKAVLNMLLFTDLELLPMKNSDRAWTWAGRNYAETPAGDQETLAVRFKSVDLATAFRDKVVECVRKLQALAAQAIREEKETGDKQFSGVAPLRLPKHLQDSARADDAMSAKVATNAQPSTQAQERVVKTETKPNGEVSKPAEPVEMLKQVHFQEPQHEEENREGEDEDDGYEQDYDQNEEYEGYYNEEDDENACYVYQGSAIVRQGDNTSTCEQAQIQVFAFDEETYSPRILVTDEHTGEILVDMLINFDYDFKLSGDSCTWSGRDYTTNEPVDKTVTIEFHDAETALQFYDNCETIRAPTYSSTDPES